MRWKKISEPLNENAEELSRILAVPKTIASLLLQRGIEDFDSAKQVYNQLFDFLNQNYSFCSLTFIKDGRRNLTYDLGRIAADFELDLKWGQCALSHFTETYGQRDTVPIAWVYFQSARLFKRLKNTEQMNFLISKALLNLKESPDQILKSLLKELKS